jgi:RNA polymerase sigma-70 factor (ECF subfamily)
MTLAQAGMRDAFAVLVQRHAQRVFNLCSRFANDAQQGQELAQDTWVAVWQSRERYQVDSDFGAWLVTVALNRCRNHSRHAKVVAAHTSQGNIDDAVTAGREYSPEQLDRLLTDERRRKVRRALAELSAPMREALLLRFAEELRYDQMTSATGTGEATLRSRVHHGLKLLKKKLEDHA